MGWHGAGWDRTAANTGSEASSLHGTYTNSVFYLPPASCLVAYHRLFGCACACIRACCLLLLLLREGISVCLCGISVGPCRVRSTAVTALMASLLHNFGPSRSVSARARGDSTDHYLAFAVRSLRLPVPILPPSLFKLLCGFRMRDAHLSKGSAFHRRQVHDGEQQFGSLQEAAQHPNAQRDGICASIAAARALQVPPCTSDDRMCPHNTVNTQYT
eukprot:scaffold12990_cov99-Isochrysis_galbana.AAC.6